MKLTIHLHIVPRLKCVVLYHPLFAGLDGVVVKETDSVVDLATSYGLDGLGVRILEGEEIFFVLNCPERLWGTLSLIFNGYQVSFPRVKRPGPKVEHTLLIVLRLRMSGCIPLLPFYAFMK
jgi:hypothetical protein